MVPPTLRSALGLFVNRPLVDCYITKILFRSLEQLFKPKSSPRRFETHILIRVHFWAFAARAFYLLALVALHAIRVMLFQPDTADADIWLTRTKNDRQDQSTGQKCDLSLRFGAIRQYDTFSEFMTNFEHFWRHRNFLKRESSSFTHRSVLLSRAIV